MFSLAKVIREIQMRKRPHIYCIYQQSQTEEVIIDKISFNYDRTLKGRITNFKNPKWETPLEDTLVKL
jgi:hypothetical protein